MDNSIKIKNTHRYYKEDYDTLRYKFNGSENIETNYSQSFQDLFVLSILDGKTNGNYVEIGGDHPIIINNSYLLETEYSWDGISFEIDSNKVEYYNSIRKNSCICSDATQVDYLKIFNEHNMPQRIDYLQVDIEPSWQSLNALKSLPLDQYRFSVITFETDLYNDGADSAEESHKILSELGYKLVIKNVAYMGNPYENWYVDAEFVNSDIVKLFEDVSDVPKESINCFLLGKESN
jgi:hypothetical protein